MIAVELARGFGSVVKHLIADPGIASSIPLTPIKITKKGDMYWFFPGKMLPYISQGSYRLADLKFHDFSMTFP